MDNFNRHTAKPTTSGTSGDVIFYDGTDFTDDFVSGKGVYFSNGSNWIQMIPYNSVKTYRALITQSSTNAPTAIVLENTLGEVPTFTYLITGNYRLSVVANLFDFNKTVVFIGQDNQSSTGMNLAYVDEFDDTKIVIQAKDVDMNTGIDDKLYHTSIEILVYP